MRANDSISQFFSQIAYRFHPKLGAFYEAHVDFLNDGFVELVCLAIANAFVWVLSYYFVGGTLVVILLLISTPITFGLKYIFHKHWVWKK